MFWELVPHTLNGIISVVLIAGHDNSLLSIIQNGAFNHAYKPQHNEIFFSSSGQFNLNVPTRPHYYIDAEKSVCY